MIIDLTKRPDRIEARWGFGDDDGGTSALAVLIREEIGGTDARYH